MIFVVLVADVTNVVSYFSVALFKVDEWLVNRTVEITLFSIVNFFINWYVFVENQSQQDVLQHL